MPFTSQIFVPDPEKYKDEKFSNVYLTLVLVALVVLHILYLKGILGFMAMVFIGAVIVKLKFNYVNKKGVERFGLLTEVLTINKNEIIIGEKTFMLSQIENLQIKAKDYDGGPGGDLYRRSDGTDNHLSFKTDGKAFKYQFYIKTKSDREMLKMLISEFKENIPPPPVR